MVFLRIISRGIASMNDIGINIGTYQKEKVGTNIGDERSIFKRQLITKTTFV